MTNESGEKYKIELSKREIRDIQYLIFKRIEYGCDTIGEARDFLEIHDKLEKTVERKHDK